MRSAVPFACFLSMIRPPGIQFESSLLQIAPVDKVKCPFMKDSNDVGFWLYTRHNPTQYHELMVNDDERLFASSIDFHAPTVIYFHAFMENPEDGSALRVREAYMLRGDTNVIMVDASRLEAGPWYFTAAENTWYIGKFAAKFIDYLVSRGLDLSKTHLVGHSLGAQAAGVAGSSLTSGKVSRITGLDPALPLFAHLPLEQKLDRSDADFVDVIHTDAGIFGVNEPVGHADFFPNGGISPQPGCELEVVIPQQMFLNKFFCSHWRSYMFYAESVMRPDAFPSSSCASWSHYTKGGCREHRTAHMGYGVEKTHNMKTTGFYVYHLAPNKNNTTEKLKNNLYRLFYFVQLVRRNEQREVDRVVKKFNTKYFRNKAESFSDTDTNVDAIYENTESKNTEVIEDQTMVESATETSELKPQKRVTKKKNKHLLIFDLDEIDENTETENTNHAKEYLDKVTIESSAKATNMTPQKMVTKKKNIHLQTLTDENNNNDNATTRNHVVKRNKRFINPFKRSEAEESENFLFRILNFLFKNGKSMIPVYSVMREINTLVKSANGELNHVTKERNNFIGTPPALNPVTYTLELGNESRTVAFLKRLLGLAPKGDRLTINGGGK